MSRVSAVFFISFVLAMGAVSSAASSECSECHDDWMVSLDQNKVIHPALEDAGCGDCHDDHGEKGALVLVEEGNDLCLQCHDGPGEGEVVHEAISDGDCTDCHDPHASSNRSLLVENVPDLCFQCHDEPGNKTGEGSVHEAVSDGECTDCHSPHSSKNRALLVESNPEVCFQCHDMPEYPEGNVHTALTDGECTDCHNPHASDNQRLLVERYVTKRFPGTFLEEMYSLCFQCHEADLVTGSAGATGFRNGSRNLHNLHVMGELKPNRYGISRRGKARSCSICHDPHGSQQEFNLVEEYKHNDILFFTMDFTSTGDGGRCVVGCHKTRGYSRKATEN